jgi:hypothetical protein
MHVSRLCTGMNIKEGRLKTNKKVSPMKWKGVCGDQTTCVSHRLFWCLLSHPMSESVSSDDRRGGE